NLKVQPFMRRWKMFSRLLSKSGTVPLKSGAKPSWRPSLESLEQRFVPTTILAQSTFDDPSQTFDGWYASEQSGELNHLTYQGSGGNPGGYITADDIGDGLYWYWRAPGKFLGNKAAAYRGTLSFDQRQHLDGGGPDQRDEDDVILNGGGYTLVYQT